jgi:hypothetical protein
MNVFLWVVQGVLALLFGMAGITKTTQPRDKLIKQLPWAEDFRTPVIRLIGGVELAGALGLIIPAATGIATILTPLAATGLAAIMTLAISVHVRRREPQAIAFNILLLAVAAVAAWGRFGPYSL